MRSPITPKAQQNQEYSTSQNTQYSLGQSIIMLGFSLTKHNEQAKCTSVDLQFRGEANELIKTKVS